MFKIDKRYARANTQRTIRFTEDLSNRLEELSKKEDVPFNTIVLQCCQYALDNLEPEERETDT